MGMQWIKSPTNPQSTVARIQGLRALAVLLLVMATPVAARPDPVSQSVAVAETPADSFVPFLIPSSANPDSPIAFPTRPIAPNGSRVEIKEAHFVFDGKPFRVWGVNFSFGANLPSGADARDVAGRLGAAGVNCVRLHHLDTSNYPEGIWNSDGKTVSKDALARLDSLVDQLARAGVFVNLNLHVGHAHSRALGLPETNTDYDKIVGLFVPELIAAQKEYAREMLSHVNPHRGVAYAKDPAVAFVEITNEDSFFMWNGDEKLRSLPPFYEQVLRGQYNAWLKNRYRTGKALSDAWNAGASPLGETLLANGDFRKSGQARSTPPDGWYLERHGEVEAVVEAVERDGVHMARARIALADKTNWHIQLNQKNLKLEGGKYYTLQFRARADSPRRIRCAVGMAHEPWSELGFGRGIRLTPEWKTYRFGFTATASDDQSRLSFALGDSDVGCELADVQLRPGGQVGLAPGESLDDGTVALYAESETRARVLDRLEFLGETEKKYFDEMRRFIREDCGYPGPVTGTIVFGPLGLYAQSGMDFIDAHAYWHHPSFPGRPWDPANWIVEQEAMTDRPDKATLFTLAISRIAGKPFTVTEYNHPAPMDFQAECVPMIASYAAAQDWDGVWIYSYKHGHRNWSADAVGNFFDICANPSKWGFMRAGAEIFAQGAIPPFREGQPFDLTGGRPLVSGLVDLEYGFTEARLRAQMAMKGILPQTFLEKRFYEALGNTGQNGVAVSRFRSATSAGETRLRWETAASGKGSKSGMTGWYVLQGDGGSVFTGHAVGFESRTEGVLAVRSPEFAAIAVVSLDGAPLTGSRSILVTACGRCENTDMPFSPDRRTVGADWGRPPVRIEAVDATLALPPGRWTCKALAPDGIPSADVPLEVTPSASAPKAIETTASSAGSRLHLHPKYGAMSYWLTR